MPSALSDGWFREQQSRWATARQARNYSLRRQGDGVIIHVHQPGDYDRLPFTLIIGTLAYEGLKVEYETIRSFHPSVVVRRARAFPRLLLSLSGLKSLIVDALLRRPKSSVRVSLPSPYLTHFYGSDEHDRFGDEIMQRLSALEGRRFSVDELYGIIFGLRRETMTPERLNTYVKGQR